MSPVTEEDLVTYTWVRLRAGVEPHEVRRQLRLKGLSESRIQELMEDAFEGRRPVSDADHLAISHTAITRRALHLPDLQKVPTTKAQVYVWRNFLVPEVCDAVVALIDQRLRDSTTADAFADPKIRTSRTSDLGQLGHDLIMQLDELMAEAIGIHWSYSDITQGQRYDIDQEYKAHYDYFPPGTHEYNVFCQFLGQRTWTFMIYLNDVEEGGGTRFRRLEKTIMPEKGKAVIWNNLNPDGSVNPYTIHHGMKVRKGSKYVITKWFRERGWGPMFPAEYYTNL